MESSVAEQRATAVAKLKRAASLPRMKDGRRPPMHVEAVSEGERRDDEKRDEESAPDSEDKESSKKVEDKVDADPEPELGPEPEPEPEPNDQPEQEPEAEEKAEETPAPETPTAPTRKRRSRSRTRSRGSKDMRNKQKPQLATNESSADEYYPSAAGEDVPPSPPLVSPIPSHFSGFQASRFLRSPISPIGNNAPLFYPGTTPSTPMLPSLDEIQKGIGLFRSNSAGAARAMAMSKLTGEPPDMSFMSPSPTPPLPGGARLGRNNTVAGGERLAARRFMMNRLGERLKETDGDQTSGGEEGAGPSTPVNGRRRPRRKRASTVLDDRDDREPMSTSPNTPVVPPSPLPPSFSNVPDPPSRGQGSPNMQQVSHAEPMGGRGVVIEDPEDEDEDPGRLSPPKPYGLPGTPARRQGPRMPHSSDVPSMASTDSAPSGTPVPFFLSSRSGAYRQDVFPASPFATPLKEKPFVDEDEGSELSLDVHSRAPTRNAFERDSEISWVAEPVPISRMPIHDDDDEDEDDEDVADAVAPKEIASLAMDEVPTEQTESRRSSQSSARQYQRPPSPSKDLFVEYETSPETTAHMPPSPASAITLSSPTTTDPPPMPQANSPIYPMRLSVATPTNFDRSPSTTDFPEWDDRGNTTDTTPKRTEGGTWERVKNAFTRSNSSNGRRSRTNSIGTRDRRYNTDSSVSRESGASLTSAKVEKGDSSGVFSQQQSQPPLMQTPSASASILSLSPQAGPPPGGVSAVPPASSADLLKYGHSKLFPFPGMFQLEEQRNRAKGISLSASSPDIVLPANGGMIEAVASTSSSSTATRSPEAPKHKLSPQASDTRLLAKYASPSGLSSAPSSASQADYFSLQPQSSTSTQGSNSGGGSMKLPMNREGVKRWLNAKRIFGSPAPSAPSTPAAPPVVEVRPGVISKKPSLSDLLMGRRDADLTADWEDIGSDKSRTPTSATSSAYPGRILVRDEQPKTTIDVNGSTPVTVLSPRSVPALNMGTHGNPPTFFPSPVNGAFPSPPEPPSSTTPDPQSSLDDFPTTRSASESFSSNVSSSQHSPDPPSGRARAAVVMERLEEVLGRGSKSSLWPAAIDDPPRKLVLSSPVLQIANANTVKDRWLFLFNDILVIAKPIMQDQETLLETSKPNPLERKFIVKSVVLLRDLKLSSDRDESRTKTSNNSNPMRHPVIRSFVHQFAKDADMAIAGLFDKSNCSDDPAALGQLIFRTIDLDRAKLGEYLARRTSKVVLKAYVDSFGFAGLRIDKALRVFLLAISIPPKPSALDYLLDAFASRWYEANAGIVAYDKELAIRLVRAIVQLNEVMHGGIAQTTGITGYPKRNVISRDFIEAFRRADARNLVSDELLEKVYASIRRERLSQARSPASSQDVLITVKRPIPPRLTYRVQSEPIILRIPQPDPQLTIQLFGQDLMFDPPVLNFVKSSEASFRVTGTSLGPKTIIMWRSGPNALAYSGLPLSSTVMVERAFMRNTFQLAFLNHQDVKRRYMFSVDDPVIRHQWTVSLKRQIDFVSASPTTVIPEESPSSRVHQAAEALAFRVLQETLITPEEDDDYPSAVRHALSRLVGSPSPDVNRFFAHGRSKSRSQVYHQHGAGQLEPALTDEPPLTEPPMADVALPDGAPPREERLWSGAELEMICRQNSSIASVLAYLQVEGPADERNHVS